MIATPDVIDRYRRAADARDFDALAACFTEEATASDEGHPYSGRDEIRDWRAAVVAKWTYTTTVTASRQVSDDRYDVDIHIAGNFPGGEADLTEAFTLRDGLIEHLAIA